tara:strand:- start:210 stop:956 length:747 start_codon:yes stop_codon:yes gene_type:complete
VIKYTRSTAGEVITEVCEHCGELASTLHISDITSKNEADPRSITIKDKDDNNIPVRTKREWIVQKSASYIQKNLLDVQEASDSYTVSKFKYGLRPDAMCSQSIDVERDVTQSFCYRTDNSKFLTKTIDGVSLSASFHNVLETEASVSGSKVGVDRKGNIIRLKTYRKIDMDTGIVEADNLKKYKGPHKEEWWRGLTDADRKYLLVNTQLLVGMIAAYGKEVDDMKVVYRYADRAAMISDVNSKGGSLS